MEKGLTVNKIWDKIGICASGLCLVHCLATPILLLAFPAFSLSHEIDEHFHQIIAVIVILSIMIAVFPHCKKHGHRDIIAIALTGTALILGSVFIHDIPHILEILLTVSGSICLMVAHFRNIKVRHGKCESESKCSH